MTIAVPPPVPTVREALRAFVAVLRDGAPMPITIDDGARAVAIVDACYRSAGARAQSKPLNLDGPWPSTVTVDT